MDAGRNSHSKAVSAATGLTGMSLVVPTYLCTRLTYKTFCPYSDTCYIFWIFVTYLVFRLLVIFFLSKASKGTASKRFYSCNLPCPLIFFHLSAFSRYLYRIGEYTHRLTFHSQEMVFKSVENRKFLLQLLVNVLKWTQMAETPCFGGQI